MLIVRVKILKVTKYGALMSDKKDQDFEKNLSLLEEVVSTLQSPNAGLNEKIKKFEEGVKNYKKCKSYLDDAQKKIKVLLDDLKQVDYDSMNNNENN